MTVSRRRVRAGGVRWIAIVLALCAVPALVLAVGVPIAVTQGDRAAMTPPSSVVRVGTRDSTSRQSVTVSFTLHRAQDVKVSRAGTVSRILIRSGDTPVSGTPLVQLDSATIVAFSEPLPLYRELRIGDRGEDVRALAAFLESAKLLGSREVDDRFGARIETAVREFERLNGYTADGVFDPDYVAYVPPQTTVGVVQASVGTRVEPGWTLMTGAPQPTAATVHATTGSGSLTPLPAGGGTLRAGSTTAPIGTYEITGASVPALFGMLTNATRESGITATEGVTQDVPTAQFSGATVEVALGRSAIVPGTAVYTSLHRMCLFQSGSKSVWSSEGSRVLVVESARAAQGEFGQTLVDPKYAGLVIARDPTTLPDTVRARCR